MINSHIKDLLLMRLVTMTFDRYYSINKITVDQFRDHGYGLKSYYEYLKYSFGFG